jgi:hypothetical protein
MHCKRKIPTIVVQKYAMYRNKLKSHEIAAGMQKP